METSVAAGLTTSEIASALGISRETLRIHFADELKNGRARKLVQALRLLDRAAKRGSVAAMKYLVSVFSGQAPAKIGKKERTRLEAANALANSPWADIIRTPAGHGILGRCRALAARPARRPPGNWSCYSRSARSVAQFEIN